MIDSVKGLGEVQMKPCNMFFVCQVHYDIFDYFDQGMNRAMFFPESKLIFIEKFKFS